MDRKTTLLTPLNGVTATTTSEVINIENARRITLLLTRANHSSGSSAFKVQVAFDKAGTFVDFNGLIQDSTNTNAQTKVRATTITLASDTSVVASMDLAHHNFKFARVVVTETTDGTHTAKMLIED